MENSGLLDGKEDVRKFLNGASDYKLKKYLKAGMPVVIEEGRWMAHKRNIEDFFIDYTRKRVVEVPEDM